MKWSDLTEGPTVEDALESLDTAQVAALTLIRYWRCRALAAERDVAHMRDKLTQHGISM